MANFPMPSYGEAELMGRVKGGFGRKNMRRFKQRGPREWKGKSVWSPVGASTITAASGQSGSVSPDGRTYYAWDTTVQAGIQWSIIIDPTLIETDIGSHTVSAPRQAQLAGLAGGIDFFPQLPGGGDPGNSDFWAGTVQYAWVKEEYDTDSPNSDGLPDPLRYSFASSGGFGMQRRENIIMCGQGTWAFNVTANSTGVTRAAGLIKSARIPFPRKPKCTLTLGKDFLGLLVQCWDLGADDGPVQGMFMFPSLRARWKLP